MNYLEVLEEKFSNRNGIPVERATVTQDEFRGLMDYFKGIIADCRFAAATRTPSSKEELDAYADAMFSVESVPNFVKVRVNSLEEKILQLKITCGKLYAGYRLDDDLWTEKDQQVIDEIM